MKYKALHKKDIVEFRRTIWKFYKKHKRSFPWRETRDPYKIFVSEIMLQQTQASRVVLFYEKFLVHFPMVSHLAKSSSRAVLSVWSGLGYNRRALHIRAAARKIMKEHNGKFPHSFAKLCALPGVGKYSANALRIFAFNKPAPLLETNIRKVYLASFFNYQRTRISDREIVPLIEQTLDAKNPREWFYALMDYGNHIAQKIGRLNMKSQHYHRQSKFDGSIRQLRGAVLRLLLERKKLTKTALSKLLKEPSYKINKTLEQMKYEKFIKIEKGGGMKNSPLIYKIR